MAGTRFTKIRMVAPSTGRYRNPSVKPAWYKARQRSVTPAQKAAERALWPLFGLTFSHNMQIDLDAAFGGAAAPTTLEIGCGSGEATQPRVWADAENDIRFPKMTSPFRK